VFEEWRGAIISFCRWYNPAVTPRISVAQWESTIANHESVHLLQSRAWGDLKSDFGWRIEHVHRGESGAQILFRSFPFGFSLAYIPKGPIGPWLPDLLLDLDEVCKEHQAFALKVEPDEAENPEMEKLLQNHGFIPSMQTIQPGATLLVDISLNEDDILAKMHPKTRYNIHLATRKGVQVRPWDDLDSFGRMMLETANRDAFGVHIPAYYQRAYDLFHPRGECELLVAEYEGKPLAAVMVFAHSQRAWYFYGASSNLERNRMPAYLLQWEAMKWAQTKGCDWYDLWGVPDETLEILERNFTSRQDGLWGVYRFKRGFGGKLVRSIGTWDKVYIPFLYRLYRWANKLLRK